VDRACDRFEAAWRSDVRPSLADYLEDLETPVGKVLLRELLKVELVYRVQRGEQVMAEEYQALLPDHVNLIAAVIAEAATTPYTPLPSSSVVDAASPPSESPPNPEYIGRYKVIRRLGGGTYGDVYLAHDGVMDRQVAVKVPSARLLATERAKEEFLREARSVARLQHEGIVRAHNFGEADGQSYLVYEYIEGESLAERIKPERLASAPLPSDEAAQIVAAIAEALHYAHLQEMFHRDIKPANILLDRQARPKVTDFGQAVREGDLPGQRGILVCTLPYMSPEQVRRESHHIDGRTDIYSLGVVLYELLCGRRPFAASTREELEDQILHREARPLRQIKDSIPPELERICLKALSKRINDRYTTAKDLADDIQTALSQSEPVHARLEAIQKRLFVVQEAVSRRAQASGAIGVSARPPGIRPDEWYALMLAAHEGKRALLPAQPPRLADYEFYLYHEPAIECCGDFYDFIPMAEDRLAVVLGDLSGRGMPAAVLMTKLVRSLRLLARDLADPASLVTALNRSLTELRLSHAFATLFYMCIDTVSHSVAVVNAGHMPPAIRRKGSAEVEGLVDGSRAGLPLGIESEHAYEAVTVALEPGDTVLLFTDGVSEAFSPNNNMFGLANLKRAMGTAAASPVQVGEAVVKAVHDFAAGRNQSDDATVICFARKLQPDPLPKVSATFTEQAESPSASECGAEAQLNDRSIPSNVGMVRQDSPNEQGLGGATVLPRLLVTEHGEKAGVIHLTCTHLLDEQVLTRLRAEFRAYLERSGARHVTLDMSRVGHISSVALHALLLFRKQLHDRGGKLGLSGVNPSVAEVLQVARLHSLFEMDTPPAAPSVAPTLSGDRGNRAAAPSANKTTLYGPYVPEKILASGGRSTLFLGHRTSSSLRVALTVWPIESAAEEEQCLGEFRQLAKLEHPGIEKLHDFGVDNGYLFVATDLLSGSRLSTWLGLGRHRPSSKETADLVALVADSLAYLHAAEIYHGDVKPANIIVTRDESPVLLLPVPPVLRAGIPGTPAYMAPEQVEGRRIDGRADLYSLGLILYEMLCGRPPFGDGHIWEKLRRVREEDPPPPRQLVPEVPRPLETICLKSIAKRVADRYSTATDLAADLRSWLAG
jgi:anti-anti-sigma factor